MAEILIDDLTTRTLEGEGVFDALMETNRIRLDREYQKTRIKGPDYSKVYLGGMEAAMQQSIIYLLGRQKADKEAELISEQILKTIAEVLLIGAQKDKIAAEIDLMVDQLITEALNRDKTTAEIDLLEDQLLTQAKERDKIDSDIALIDQKTATEVVNTANATKQGLLITEQIAKTVSETALITQKKTTEVQQELVLKKQIEKLTQDILLAAAQVSKMAVEETLIGLQGDKATAEIALLAQREITETAQTVDAAGGILGAQTTVYAKQAEGFDRDAEQKMMKMMADTYSVEKTADSDTIVPPSLNSGSIDSVVNWAKSGHSVP